MKILALDPAMHCGFAHSDGYSGVWRLDVIGTGHPGLRLIRLRDLLLGAHREWGFDVIAYEEASFGSPNQNVKALHNELRGVIRMVAAEVGCKPVDGYAPTTIKKFATGSGNADKAQMVAAWARHHPGRPVTDDNEADALWLLEMATHNAKLFGRSVVTKRKRTAKA